MGKYPIFTIKQEPSFYTVKGHLMSKSKEKLCLFAGSFLPSDPAIIEGAKKLGAKIGAGGYDLVYGGGTGGVMGIVAQAAKDAGSNILAVTLQKYADEEQIDGATIMLVETEAERFKAFTDTNPKAYFAMPGGPASLREALQSLEEAVYGSGSPVILVKIGAYLDGIKQYFDLAVQAGMIKDNKKDSLKLWYPDNELDEVLNEKKDAVISIGSKRDIKP
jgi:hypothetical protein